LLRGGFILSPMTSPVISVEHLSKQYDLGVVGTGTLTRDFERWWASARSKPDPYAIIGREHTQKKKGDSILALDDVSFTVQQGEALGIIGRNGAGKSTLLKILSRVTAPTSGVVKVKGRIGSLLEVGTGFHPELTGRENVYLNGAILGMKKDEVTRKFDEIVDFSGVEKFLDTPVKRYSSGMYVRLAFAVAAHLDPEILIVDEVLAVGDAEFQKKCLGKMGDVAGEGRTVLFVSHNLVSISNLCKTTILLDNGKFVRRGDSITVISEYLKRSSKTTNGTEGVLSRDQRTKDRIVDVRLRMGNTDTSTAVSGMPLGIVIEYELANKCDDVDFEIGIYNSLEEKLVHLSSKESKRKPWRLRTSGKVICNIPKLALPGGKYHLNVAFYVNRVLVSHLQNAFEMVIQDGDFFGTGSYPIRSIRKLLMENEWIVDHE